MLSVQGKGYSRIYSENPFYEDPPPKAFYHPTQEKALSQAEKQLALSPTRADKKKQQQNEVQNVEKKFLAGSHTIKPLTDVQTHIPKSPDSSNFNESWPDSERPSSPSVAAEDRWRQHSLPYASVRKHAQPTFTSRPFTSDHPASQPGDQVSGTHAAASSSAFDFHEGHGVSLLGLESRQFLSEKEAGKSGRSEGKHGKVGASSGTAEKGSVLQRYIERFRHGTPMSREERLKMEKNSKEEFWWLDSGLPTPNSTSTPKEEEGKSLPFTCQGRGTLTVENLRKRDDLDVATAQLLEKANRVLHSAGSMTSSGPVVSTEGLGSTGSDITGNISGSSFSEPAVRPAFLPRDEVLYHRPDRQMGKGRSAKTTPQKDILYKWRLQRKLEAARHGPYVPVDGTNDRPPKTAAEKDIERRLAGFRENLMGRGPVVMMQLQQARVEKDMKQVHLMMDSAVQTSPPSSSSAPSSHLSTTHPQSWASDHKTVTTHHQNGGQTLHLHPHPYPSKHDVSTECADVHTETQLKAGKQFPPTTDKDLYSNRSKDRESTKHRNSSHKDVQYRQFLEAERPQDGGDRMTKHASSHTTKDSSTLTKRTSDTESVKESRPGSSKSMQGNIEDIRSTSSEASQDIPQEPVKGRDHSRIVYPNDAGDGSFTEVKGPDPSRKKSSDKSASVDDKDMLKLTDRDADSDSSSGRREAGREQKNSVRKQTSKQHKDKSRQEVSSPLQSSNQNNSKQRATELPSSQTIDKLVFEDPGGQKVPRRRPPTDCERSSGVQQRSGAERLQRSEVMPPPQYSSSPARTPLSSAIGQVVQDRLFDMSVSVLSSVDSVSSLQHSAASPFLAARNTSTVGESDCESDGEFESDPLLMVLRQQRQHYEAQLKCLDSILAERDVS